MGKTLFDKIWDKHLVKSIDDGPSVIYIDRQFIHEVTSPVAFGGLEKRGLKVFRAEQTTAMPDHNVPTINQEKPISDQLGRDQVATLESNCSKYGITHYGLNSEDHGIIHVVGPELAYTKPGMTIVCGDSHTSTHGAFGSIAFGIGTSEVEMVFASQCIMQPKPKTLLINVEGELGELVSAKDIALYIISEISTSGGTGYFIEFAGSAIRSLSMEGRMTLCNMSIECGARGGMVAPDQTTFDYVAGRKFAPKGAEWDAAIEEWSQLKSDQDAEFDLVLNYDAADIEPMITYGTNPGMGSKVTAAIPTAEGLTGADKISFEKSLAYMGFEQNDQLIGKPIDYVFVGSCTNGRIEDFREFARLVKGKKKADNVIVWLVPGSKHVQKMAIEEGVVEILNNAGFEFRQPGCSACLAMNDDKVPAGKYSVSTSNRNFEGRQGPGARTLLAGVAVAAAAAVTGVITDPRTL